MRLGEVMNDIEQHDYYNSDDGQDTVPSWIRAHFLLEDELEYERSGLSQATKKVSQVCPASFTPKGRHVPSHKYAEQIPLV